MFLSCSPLSVTLTALSLVPEQSELSPWLSPVLVLPVLQLLSCLNLTEPLADQRTHSRNYDLAQSLLRSISRETDKPRQVTEVSKSLPLIQSWISAWNRHTFADFISSFLVLISLVHLWHFLSVPGTTSSACPSPYCGNWQMIRQQQLIGC